MEGDVVTVCCRYCC